MCVWALHQRLSDRLQVTRINDTGELDAWLLTRYDSTHGRFDQLWWIRRMALSWRVSAPVSREKSKRKTSDGMTSIWSWALGMHPDHHALAHIQAGAPRVQVGAPAGPDMPLTLIRGLNEDQLSPEHTHWSLGSCTTNCLGVTLTALEGLTIESGTYTTIHSYTNDQVLIDQAHRDPRRARAAALSMVPTTTNALNALEWVMPEIAGVGLLHARPRQCVLCGHDPVSANH